MNTASRLISPRATRSRRSINSLWCDAGSYPQCRHHSRRLLRTRRRFSSSSAAMDGEMSNTPYSGSVVDLSFTELGFVISCCTENVHQLFVSDVIPVLVEFLICRDSGPACSGVLDVLHDFDDRALGSDVAFRRGRDLAADHGLQRRHLLDCVALTNGEQTIDFLPDERLGTLSFAMLPFSRWIAGLPFAETGVDRRFAVPDRIAVFRRLFLFLLRTYCSPPRARAEPPLPPPPS